MDYLAFYRKYRPQVFEDVLGQDNIILSLINQIREAKLSHGYLFCGPRGTGKTSTAKILARALNCEHPKGHNPCNQCYTCQAILNDSFLDVIEMDAASHNGVDDIRSLIDGVKFPPSYGRKKVVIIDEAHMLSKEAFNALLKTLEEPPSYIVFILATTEVNKLPQTIVSRLLRYDFKRIEPREMAKHLLLVSKREGVELSEGAALKIALMADGALRDALGILEKVASVERNNIDEQALARIMGLGDEMSLALFTKLMERDAVGLIDIATKVYKSGKSLELVLEEITELMRKALVFAAVESKEKSGINDREYSVFKQLGLLGQKHFLLGALEELLSITKTRNFSNQRAAFEFVLLKICFKDGYEARREVQTESKAEPLPKLKNIIEGQKGTEGAAAARPTFRLETKVEHKAATAAVFQNDLGVEAGPELSQTVKAEIGSFGSQIEEGPITQMRPHSEAGREAGIASPTEAGPLDEAKTQREPEYGTPVNQGARPELGSKREPDPMTGAKLEAEAESAAKAGFEAGIEPEFESPIQAGIQEGGETGTETGIEAEVKTGTETDIETKIKADAEIKAGQEAVGANFNLDTEPNFQAFYEASSLVTGTSEAAALTQAALSEAARPEAAISEAAKPVEAIQVATQPAKSSDEAPAFDAGMTAPKAGGAEVLEWSNSEFVSRPEEPFTKQLEGDGIGLSQAQSQNHPPSQSQVTSSASVQTANQMAIERHVASELEAAPAKMESLSSRFAGRDPYDGLKNGFEQLKNRYMTKKAPEDTGSNAEAEGSDSLPTLAQIKREAAGQEDAPIAGDPQGLDKPVGDNKKAGFEINNEEDLRRKWLDIQAEVKKTSAVAASILAKFSLKSYSDEEILLELDEKFRMLEKSLKFSNLSDIIKNVVLKMDGIEPSISIAVN